MKKIILLLTALFSIQNVLAIEKGPLYPMKILTMAMDVTLPDNPSNEYMGYSKEDLPDDPNAHLIANAFSSAMKKEIDAYPKKFNYLNSAPTTKKVSGEVTSKYIRSTETDNYHFIFFVGHALKYTIFPYSSYHGFKFENSKSFGGKTYWVWLYACEFFKNVVSGDSNINSMFNGVHSILGFATKVSAEDESIEVPKEFAYQWVTNKKSIWDAFKLAVQHQLHNTGNTAGSAEFLKVSMTDVNVPAIAYRYGFIDGKIHAPANEKYETINKGPVFNADVYKNDASHLIIKKQPFTGYTY